MNRHTKGALVALAAISIAVAGCQDQGTDELESLDTLPSQDMTMPSQSADELDATDEASPGES